MKSHSAAVVSDEHLAASAEKWGQTEGAEWTKEAVWIRDIFESESIEPKEDERTRERRADLDAFVSCSFFLQSTSPRRLPLTPPFGESFPSLHFVFSLLKRVADLHASRSLCVFLSLFRWIPRTDWGMSSDPSGRAVKIHDQAYEGGVKQE